MPAFSRTRAIGMMWASTVASSRSIGFRASMNFTARSTASSSHTEPTSS